jgi:uncharacterized protein (TIRG00374 family)
MRVLKKIIPIIVIVIIIYASFLLLSDINKISEKIINFKIELIPIIITLVIASWIIVYIRWNILLKIIEIKIPHRINFQIFLAGGALGITPGKIGELYKSQILKDKFDIPRSKTAPLFIVEKFFDVTGALIVTSFGIWFIPELGYLSILGIIGLFFIYRILISKKLFNKMLVFFNKIKYFRKFLEPLASSHEILTQILQNKKMILVSSLSIFYWLVIGVAAYFILQGFGITTIELINVISTYSSSLLIGAISFIPGGIAVAEGSLVGLFSIQGINLAEAMVIVVIIRLFTLWFSTIAGFIALKTSNSF